MEYTDNGIVPNSLNKFHDYKILSYARCIYRTKFYWKRLLVYRPSVCVSVHPNKKQILIGHICICSLWESNLQTRALFLLSNPRTQINGSFALYKNMIITFQIAWNNGPLTSSQIKLASWVNCRRGCVTWKRPFYGWEHFEGMSVTASVLHPVFYK